MGRLNNWITIFPKITSLYTLGVLVAFAAKGQKSPQPYKLTDQKGKEIRWDKLISECQKADVVLFGEYHNNSLLHWWQWQVGKSLLADTRAEWVLGLEMFEFDNQLALDTSKAISSKNRNIRFWPNYTEDYAPIVDEFKEKGRYILASNTPRWVASSVMRGGFSVLDTLNPSFRKFIPSSPIPFDSTLGCYAKMLEMFAGHGKVNYNFPRAQAIKDAVMGFRITEQLKLGKKVFHLNGSWHSDNYEGIVYYLKQYSPNSKVLVISTETVENFDNPKGKKREGLKGTYNFLFPEDYHKSH